MCAIVSLFGINPRVMLSHDFVLITRHRPHGMCPGQKSTFTQDRFTHFSIKWNPIRLSGPVHENISICQQTVNRTFCNMT